jgi:hypothetical protein
MSMRIFSLCLPLALLSGCSKGDSAPAVPHQTIACAVHGEADFAEDCTAERVAQDGKPFIIVRYADGGFRRLEVLEDGRGVAAADGADVADVKLSGDHLDVTIGPDRYRIPVSVKSDAPKQ